MISSDNTKSVRDREMSAVMYNLKEQRVLEKSLQTLQHEQTYSLKLLELDHREIKVQYRKLKDKVSKIKSHLPNEDIRNFRELDLQGKLKPTHECVVLSSAVKIAAASRRLNLSSDRSASRRSIRSALPRISIQKDTATLRSKSPSSASNSPNPALVKRSNSLADVLSESIHQTIMQQPKTASFVQFSTVPQRPNDIPPNESEDLIRTMKTESPILLQKQETLTVPEVVTNLVSGEKSGQSLRAHSAYSHSHSPFSSHVAATKDARAGLSTAPAQYNNMRRLSQVSHDSIDSNLGESIYEERRLELLEEESLRAEILEKKTRDFLKQVEVYLQRKPRLQSSRAVTSNPNSDTSPGKPRSYDSTSYNRHQRFHRRNKFSETDITPTYLPENNYKERLITLWKDVNKCRYLRLPDDKIDLSGINTLVRDQLKLFEAVKHAERAPLREAWEN